MRAGSGLSAQRRRCSPIRHSISAVRCRDSASQARRRPRCRNARRSGSARRCRELNRWHDWRAGTARVASSCGCRGSGAPGSRRGVCRAAHIAAAQTLRLRWFVEARAGDGSPPRRTQDFQSAPGMIGQCPAVFRIDHAHWDGDEGEVFAMQLPALLVTQLLQDDSPTFGLLPHVEFDGALSYLFNALWEQSAAGMPWGSMYSEGVALALLGLLGTSTTSALASNPSTPDDSAHATTLARSHI